jgi:addiction module RelB/DinJ family antitoxin
MNTTLTIKTPKKLRDDAKHTAKTLGIPLTTVMNAMLKQFVRDRRLVLEVECPYPSHTPNAETRRAIREALDPKKRAAMKSYATTDEMFEDILGKNWRVRA